MARLHTGRMQPSCTYDAATNRIYVFAGFYGETRDIITVNYYPEGSTEYYSIDNDTWTVGAPELPSFAVYSATVNTNDGFIYLFNGFIGYKKTIYRYNIGNDTWTYLGPTNKDNYSQSKFDDETQKMLRSLILLLKLVLTTKKKISSYFLAVRIQRTMAANTSI